MYIICWFIAYSLKGFEKCIKTVLVHKESSGMIVWNVENGFKYTAQMLEKYVGINAVKIKHYVLK